MKRILICLMLLLASCAQGQTSQKSLASDGNTFLSQCGNYDTASLGCTMYVGGVMDGRSLSDKPGFCLPDGITYGQILRVSIKYMQDHPEQLHYPTYLLVVAAHVNAFPCAAPVAITPNPPKAGVK